MALSHTIDLPTERDTLALGARLAALAARGDVIALSGDLGAGKTTFARGFIAALAAAHGVPPEEVPSPSFPIVETYVFGEVRLWHFDLYRLARDAELDELGLEEAFAEGITLIEWPERAERRLPRDRLLVRFEFKGTGRRATLTGSLAAAQDKSFREFA